MSASKIFEGFKSIGLVASSVPNIIRNIEKLGQVRIVTAVGKSFHVYDNHLRLIEACQAHSTDINVIASDSLYIYTAAGDEIFAWKFGHRWKAKSFKGCLEPVTHLLPFGPHLLAVDESSSLYMWEIRSEELIMTRPFDLKHFKISAILHPATYLNKILLGSFQGRIQLWNIKTQTCIYIFDGWDHQVTQLTQAPAIDVIAIGLANGDIYIHNLKFDETIMKFRQEWGSVLGLSFRADGHPHLVSASPAGHLAIWNLEAKKLEAQMRNVHNGQIYGCNFINNEPLLVTNSNDNFLKVWCFDQSDSTGRILYQRDGHSAPPTRIRFHGAKGQYILSAGLDSSLRAFSVFSERLSKNLGFGKFEKKKVRKINVYKEAKKMPPIKEFTFETTREKEWDGIAACHKNVDIVTTWSFDKCRMGSHKLIHKRFLGQQNVEALCVCLTSCGNFVIIGYNTGNLDRFNIQSGIYRISYGSPLAHKGSVNGVVCDGFNQIIVSGGCDKKLKFWKFKGSLISEIKFSSPIEQLLMHKENFLIAVVTDDFIVWIIDYETRKIIRKFDSHKKQITDVNFNSECRWLLTASLDSTIRVWDLPLGLTIDAFKTSSPCVSLCLSPNDQLLATVHLDDVGIYLWSNMTLYAHITLLPLPEFFEVNLLEMPAVKCDEDDENEEDAIDPVCPVQSEEMEVDETYISPDQIAEDLITLSLLPHSRWKNLLHLDLIKKRNKLKEPVKKPESAPFFLPTLPGLEPKFNFEDKSEGEKTKSQIIKRQTTISLFGQLLIDCSNESDYSKFIDHLKSLNPSKIDVEIRSLSPETINTNKLMILFLDVIESSLNKKIDFELIQSYLGLFLKIHAEAILKDKVLKQKCTSIITEVEASWSRLEEDFNKTFCIINYLRNVVL